MSITTISTFINSSTSSIIHVTDVEYINTDKEQNNVRSTCLQQSSPSFTQSTYDLIQFLLTWQPEDFGVKVTDFPYQLKQKGRAIKMKKSTFVKILLGEKKSKHVIDSSQLVTSNLVYFHHYATSTESLDLVMKKLINTSMSDDPFVKHLISIEGKSNTRSALHELQTRKIKN